MMGKLKLWKRKRMKRAKKYLKQDAKTNFKRFNEKIV